MIPYSAMDVALLRITQPLRRESESHNAPHVLPVPASISTFSIPLHSDSTDTFPSSLMLLTENIHSTSLGDISLHR